MLSLALQQSVRASGSIETAAFTTYPPVKLVSRLPFSKSLVSGRSKPSSIHSQTLFNLKLNCEAKKDIKISASAAAAAVEDVEEAPTEDSTSTQPEKEKLGVRVKAMQKPRLVLKFIWMEKNIGLALDQVIPAHGTIPLSPYFFWPRKDAWEELKVLLESKPWISQKQMIILLNQATDIINLWQQSGGDLS